MEDDAGRDPRAAVGDELAGGQRRQRLVPGSVERARDPARHPVDRVRLAAEARRQASVHDHELAQPPLELGRLDRVPAALARLEQRRLDPLLAAARAGRARPRGRSPRRRRGRNGAGATRAAPHPRASRRRRRSSPAPIPAAPAARREALRRRAADGVRRLRPARPRSRSRSRNAAPGMCPARYCPAPERGVVERPAAVHEARSAPLQR